MSNYFPNAGDKDSKSKTILRDIPSAEMQIGDDIKENNGR